MRELIKPVLVASGVPLMIVLVVRIFTPVPSQSKDEFPTKVFVPSRVEVVEKKGTKGSNYFDLLFHHPDGSTYSLRDPEPEPIEDRYRRIPQGQPLSITYPETHDGNVLMEIAVTGSPRSPIMSFADMMEKYASRRRVVYIVAGVWFALGTLILYGLWRVDVKKPARQH